MKKRRCIIFHDFLIERGGGERVVDILSKFLNASIVTWFYEKDLTYDSFKTSKIFYNNNILNKIVIHIKPLKLFGASFFFGKQLRNIKNLFNEIFDIAIFSGFYSVFFAKFLNIPKIYYIQAEPLSYVLKRESYKGKISSRFYSLFYKLFLRKLEKDGILSMDKIIANSNYTKKIYEDYFNVKVENVVYPPVDTKKFYFKKIGSFFLLVSRLYPHKRVQVVARVFTKLPDEKLTIVGSGPLSNYIEKLALKHKNIVYLGTVSDKKLRQLYAECKAVIYISEMEHFGIVPVEANASGKPAIVSKEGGLPETIVHEKTGLIIEPPYEDNLMKIIKTFDNYDFSVKECIKSSKRFDIKSFKKNFKKILF
ncbi:MAG: glycosyltransferase [Candidatus Aenigmatarchaeota archaeon]